MAVRDSITLLHVSDPQFGRFHRFGNLGEDGDDFDTLFGRLDLDLEMLEGDGVRPELIVVSGDLAEWGYKSEFDDARVFLGRLAERVRVPHDKVIVVPGNHDVNRKLSEAYFAECEGDERAPAEPYAPKWKPFRALLEDFYGDSSDIAFTPEAPWSFWEFEDLNLVVAGLNSTMKESHLPEDHYGWLGEPQVRWFADRLERYVERGWFRLGVVHHNVRRGAVDDDENLRDADRLTDVLGAHLNLVLHGHTHNAKGDWLSPALPVLSTSSAGLSREARPEEVPNQYQALRIHGAGIDRWARRYVPGQGRWVGDTGISDDGREWRTSVPVSFMSVGGTFAGLDAPPAARDAKRRLRSRVRDETFAERVAEICRLRNRGADHDVEVTSHRHPSGLNYLRVSVSDGRTVEIFPVGVLKDTATQDALEAFDAHVFAEYRQFDSGVRCELVYAGERAGDHLVDDAARRNILLRSFLEFQGIIDFRAYLTQQTARLNSDIVYPPHLYVPQRLTVEIGGERRESADAIAEALTWLGEAPARFVLVLGSFGAGKTFLLHEVARRVPDELPHLTPILVDMRSLEKASDLLQLVAQHLTASGERFIDLDGFPYMLDQGRIALLFDGFDELAQRVTYKRAADHFETLLQAIRGRAKVVVTSRTQHFESDQQVKTVLMARAEAVRGLRLCRVHPFDEEQIKAFLIRRLGDEDAADRRFRLIDEVKDLLGLSKNPRMLGFITNLPEEQLLAARDRSGSISAAELYRLLIERWLTFEYDRAQPKGAAPTLSVQERWRFATKLALHIWPKLDATARLSELQEQVSEGLDALVAEPRLDEDTATHLVGSGTLLVRDEEGRFAFVHQSVMEWLVANHVAEELRTGVPSPLLSERDMTQLMAEFLIDLAGEDTARAWAEAALQAEDARGKANALLVMDRLGVTVRDASLRGQELSGYTLHGKNFAGADLTRADLSEAQLEGADLRDADLTDAVLERADLTNASLARANLRGARAARARLLGADLTGADLTGADLRRAALVGATLPDELAAEQTFGAALPGMPIELSFSIAESYEAVAWSPDGSLIAVAGASGTVVICDALEGTEIRRLRGHLSVVYSLAFSPDGGTLVSGGEDGVIRQWNVSTGEERFRLGASGAEAIHAVALSPDGTLLAAAGTDTVVRLWKLDSAAPVRELRGHADWVRTVAFSPAGDALASAGDDSEVLIWDIATGLEIGRLTGHTDWILSLAFAPDGQVLASAGEDGITRLWDWRQGVERLQVTAGAEGVNAVAFSPDGVEVATAGDDNVVRLWNPETGEPLEALESHTESVTGLAYSRDGRLASCGTDLTVNLWDGSSSTPLEGDNYWLYAVAFSPDGRRIAVVGDDQSVRIWDRATGKQVVRLDGHGSWLYAVAYSPAGNVLASAGRDMAIRLWDTATEQSRLLLGHRDWVRSLAFTPDGSILVSAGNDSTIRFWDVAAGTEERCWTVGPGAISTVTVSPDGSLVAAAGEEEDSSIWIREIESAVTLELIATRAQRVRSLAFSPDGAWLAAADSHGAAHFMSRDDNWQFKGVDESTVLGTGILNAVAFSPDSETLAVAGEDGIVWLLAVPSGEVRGALASNNGSINSVMFAPDGLQLATAGDDGTIRLWDLEQAREALILFSADDWWAAFAHDGRYKADGAIDGLAWLGVGLCRFEIGELDAFAPEAARRVDLDEPL